MRNIIRQVQEPLEHPSKIWLWLMRSVSAIFSFSVHAFCFLCALSNVSQIWQRQLNIHISFKLNFLTENSLNSILNLMKSHSGGSGSEQESKTLIGTLAQTKRQKDTHYHNYFFYYNSLGLWGEALAVLLPGLLHPPVHLLPLHLLLSSPEIRMNMGAQMNCFGRLNWTKWGKISDLQKRNWLSWDKFGLKFIIWLQKLPGLWVFEIVYISCCMIFTWRELDLRSSHKWGSQVRTSRDWGGVMISQR